MSLTSNPDPSSDLISASTLSAFHNPDEDWYLFFDPQSFVDCLLCLMRHAPGEDAQVTLLSQWAHIPVPRWLPASSLLGALGKAGWVEEVLHSIITGTYAHEAHTSLFRMSSFKLAFYTKLLSSFLCINSLQILTLLTLSLSPLPPPTPLLERPSSLARPFLTICWQGARLRKSLWGKVPLERQLSGLPSPTLAHSRPPGLASRMQETDWPESQPSCHRVCPKIKDTTQTRPSCTFLRTCARPTDKGCSFFFIMAGKLNTSDDCL